MMNDEDAHLSSSEERGLDRILSLSDGVFAFAITLLVLGLAVPQISEDGLGQFALTSKLLNSLAADSTAFYSYAVSFAVIAIWWVAHHRLFRHIKKYDATLMWRNLFFLLFITIIPFLTQLMNQYGNVGVAVMIYDASQLIGGLAIAAVWTHASKHHLLVSRSLTDSQIKNIQMRNYVPSIVFLIALILAAFLSYTYHFLQIPPGFANFALFGIAPVMRVAGRKSKSQDEP
jgi:uncharacterized membrane protein